MIDLTRRSLFAGVASLVDPVRREPVLVEYALTADHTLGCGDGPESVTVPKA